MADANSISHDGDDDQELKHALMAAFGDDGLCLLDDDDEADGNVCAQVHNPVCSFGSVDESPLIRFVQELNTAIYADRPAGTFLDSTNSRIVLCVVGDQQYGLPICNVREIARYPQVTPLPHTPFWLRGVANLRGQITSVTDFRVLIDDSSDPPIVNEKIVVVQNDEQTACTAIAFDHVIGMRKFEGEPGSVSMLDRSVGAIASGTIRIDQENTILIDINKLLDRGRLSFGT